MSSKTITIANRPGGVPTDYDALPVLADEADAYGLRRVSDGTVIVAAGATLAKTATGTYARTVTGLTAGVAYQYALRRVIAGVTRTTTRTFTLSAAPADSGLYASPNDMLDRWGEALLIKVSQRNASLKAVDWDQVGRALDAARNTINVGLAAGRYAVPLANMDAVTTDLLRDLCTRQALVWLYETRVGQDLDEEGRPISPAKQHALYVANKLAMIRTNLLRISAATRPNAPTGIVIPAVR